MEIRTLQEILGEVRQNDLSEFRTKMEAMEAAKKMELEAQGFETFDSILDKRAHSARDTETGDGQPQRNVQATTTTEGPEEKGSEEVFSKFLQSIRG